MLLPATLTLLVPALVGELHTDPLRGFEIEVPEGWSTEEKVGGSEVAFALNIRPPGVTKGIAVAVQITPEEGGATLAELYARDLERVRGGGRYSELEEYEIEIAGERAPSFRFDYRTATTTYRIHRSHLLREGSSWVLQRNAPVEEYEEWAEALDRVLASFDFGELSEQGERDRRLAELAARCGSEVRWAASWEEATARARAESRPVLLVAWLLASFTGATTARHGLLMDPDVIEFVNERFVPLWYERGMSGAFVESYGVGATAFGKALIAFGPDGEVLFQTHELDSPTVAHQFLRERLARFPEYAGTPVAEDWPPVGRAARHVARGELDLAIASLEGRRTVGERILLARARRLDRDGEGALAALAAAREAGGEREPALWVEEARVLLGLGRREEARRSLLQVLSSGEEESVRLEAGFLLSLLDLLEERRDSARECWMALVEEHPEDRHAWLAAQRLREDAAGTLYPPTFRWPEEPAIAEVVAPRESAPVDAELASEALSEAVGWLLEAQQPDGSWVSPTEVLQGGWDAPEPFVDSITALAGRAVLSRGGVEGCEESARRALAFVLASVASREVTPPYTFVMDYTTWSDACLLAFLADARRAGLAEVDELAPAVRSLLRDLRARQQSGGGWTYLVTGGSASGRPPSHSMSFVTAGVVRALFRVRDAGFEVPAEMLDPAIACLERMRNDDGGFEYRLVHEREDAPRDTALAGAAGRMPVCELALHLAGRSTDERLRGAIATFVRHADLYVAETGKALAHAGPHIIGCHYLLFDYEGAAEAAGCLEPDPRTTLALREMILASRLAGGAFLDNPVVGRACATAMAVLALGELGG